MLCQTKVVEKCRSHGIHITGYVGSRMVLYSTLWLTTSTRLRSGTLRSFVLHSSSTLSSSPWHRTTKAKREPKC